MHALPSPGQFLSPEQLQAAVAAGELQLINQSMFLPSPEFAGFMGPVVFGPTSPVRMPTIGIAPPTAHLPPAQIPLPVGQVEADLIHTTARAPAQKSEVLTFEIGGSGGARWDTEERAEPVKYKLEA